jgi:hypothetical protein
MDVKNLTFQKQKGDLMKLLPFKRKIETPPAPSLPAPQPQQPPQEQKQPKPITVIFCVPGNKFSRDFLYSWTELLMHCVMNGIRPILSCQYSCNIYYARNMCLGGNVQLGENQKPFNNGKVKYDYMVWIDSDMVFTPQQFALLLEDVKKNPIVSGIYRMTDGNYAAVEKWDTAYFRKNGHFEFLTEQALNGKTELMPVSYNGMGFFAVQKGVFESLTYPWFRPIEKRIGDAVDFTMEDVALCIRARQAGYKVLIDPRIRVAHQKEVLL